MRLVHAVASAHWSTIAPTLVAAAALFIGARLARRSALLEFVRKERLDSLALIIRVQSDLVDALEDGINEMAEAGELSVAFWDDWMAEFDGIREAQARLHLVCSNRLGDVLHTIDEAGAFAHALVILPVEDATLEALRRLHVTMLTGLSVLLQEGRRDLTSMRLGIRYRRVPLDALAAAGDENASAESPTGRSGPPATATR